MAYTDKSLSCTDCGTNFTFSSSEQEFYASKGLVNEPKRCPECRAARKQQRGGRDSGGYGGSRPRQMYPAVCASCGNNCEVPFEPREGRPVYCSDCYSPSRR